MTKKCDYCEKSIDIHQGNYVNVYTKPGELHAFHTDCYKTSVIDDWRKEAGF